MHYGTLAQPRSHYAQAVDEPRLDKLLLRASEIFLGELTYQSDAELREILPPLVAAGYVVIDGVSPTGEFWRFTPEGVERQEQLGLLDS